MSAFIVSDKHINILVTYAIEKKIYFDGRPINTLNAQEMAQLLYKANVQSVNYRYNDKSKFNGFTFKPEPITSFKHADIFKLAESLAYQSCELKTWEKSKACRLLSTISINAAWELSEVKSSQVWSV